jgi:hypothetical protein
VQQQAAELAALRAELKAMRAGLADLPRASVDERVAGD